MGVYVNIPYRRGTIQADCDGQRITIYPLRFLCKLQDLDERIFDRGWNERARRLRLKTAAMAHAWQASGQSPEYVCPCSDKIEIGDWVWRTWKMRFFQYIDTEPMVGTLLGTLAKFNRRWCIRPSVMVSPGVEMPVIEFNARRNKAYAKFTVDDLSAASGSLFPAKT